MTTRYLNADTGVDTGAGGVGAPWKTISYALTHCTTGDTLYLESATAKYSLSYNEMYQIPGLSDLTYLGQSNQNVEIDLPTAQTVIWAGAAGALSMKFDNIKFVKDNGYNNFGCFQPLAPAVSTFDHCRFIGDALTGAACWFGAFLNYAGLQTHITVKNSIFYNDLVAWNSVFKGAYSTELLNISFFNNVFYNMTYFIHTGNKYFQATLKNNIIHTLGAFEDGWTGAWAYNPLNLAEYNDFYNVTYNAPSGTGNINADPLFKDLANYNFGLRPTSPCFDTGITI